MEVVVTTGAIKMHKTLVKLSPPTNQHPTFYRPDALPVAKSKHSTLTVKRCSYSALSSAMKYDYNVCKMSRSNYW